MKLFNQYLVDNKKVFIFPKYICLKVKVTVQLEFEFIMMSLTNTLTTMPRVLLLSSINFNGMSTNQEVRELPLLYVHIHIFSVLISKEFIWFLFRIQLHIKLTNLILIF